MCRSRTCPRSSPGSPRPWPRPGSCWRSPVRSPAWRWCWRRSVCTVWCPFRRGSAPEIGVRVALGASDRDVQRLILGQGMIVAAIGIVLGLGASLALDPGGKQLSGGRERHRSGHFHRRAPGAARGRSPGLLPSGAPGDVHRSDQRAAGGGNGRCRGQNTACLPFLTFRSIVSLCPDPVPCGTFRWRSFSLRPQPSPSGKSRMPSVMPPRAIMRTSSPGCRR